MAAVRGQMRDSIFFGETYSAHMQTSPPRMRAFSSGVRRPPDRPADRPDKVRRRLDVVEIIAGGENSLIALARRIGQRLRPPPRLDHDILRQRGVQNLVPALHALAVFGHDFFDLQVEGRLKIVLGLEAVRLHEGRNIGRVGAHSLPFTSSPPM